MNGTLAVAGLSARLMAESARRGGYRVVAMDVFGDIDTRRAAAAWTRIGEPSAMRLDPDLTLAALASFAREPDVVGWIAGSGFEAIPDVLARGSRIAPLIGNAPDVLSRVRDPDIFFLRLDALGIPHPPTSREPPLSLSDWLVKDATGSGAWHIRAARSEDARHSLPAGVYYQRRMPGRPLGALFVADGRRARVIGVSEQTIRPRHGHPFVYCGIVGPVPLDATLANRIDEAVQAIVSDMALVGLNSLDLLQDGDDFCVLEVNARPSSSIALYDAAYERGLIDAHIQAAQRGSFPVDFPSVPLHGNEIVFADRRCRATPDTVHRLAATGWCRDLPQPDTRFMNGEPVCTVTAHAPTLSELHATLDSRREQASRWLEVLHG